MVSLLNFNTAEIQEPETRPDTDILSTITVLTSVRFCTKKISRDKNGKLIKNGDSCNFSAGTGQCKTLPLSDLPALIKSLNVKQVLVQGIPKRADLPENFNVLSEDKFKRKFGAGKNSNDTLDTITRRQIDFEFSKFTPFIQMIDYDPYTSREPLTWKERQQAMDKLTGGHWSDVGKVVSGSASSYIYDDTGVEVTGSGAGDHTYFMVKAGSDMKRFKDILMKRSCINGYGYYKISRKVRRLLLRSDLFDAAVLGSPERVDYAAGAVIPAGWEQRRPDPEYHDGGVFDPALVPDLTPEEVTQYHEWNNAARSELMPIAVKAAAKKAKDEAPEMAKSSGKSIETCERIILAACNPEAEYTDLYGDIVLHFDDDDLGSVSVDDVLKDLPKYDEATLSDPNGDSGRRCTARLYANTAENKPTINGMEHGGSISFLHAGEPPKESVDVFSEFIQWITDCGEDKKKILSGWLKEIKKIHVELDEALIQLCIVELSNATGSTKQALKRDLKKAVAGWNKTKRLEAKAELQEAVDNIELPFCFWDITPDNDGNLQIEFQNEAMYSFFEDEGFCNTESYGEKRLVRIKDNVCSEQDVDDVRNFIVNEAMQRLPREIAPGVTAYRLKAELRENIAMHVNIPKVETLRREETHKHRDTKDTTYFYFKNGFVSVNSKTGVFLNDYSSLKNSGKFIWEKSINEHSINIQDPRPSIFEQFCKNVCTHDQVNPDGISSAPKVDVSRYKALKTVIGYLLTRYNSPSLAKAIILTDGQISDTPEGGTGKTILAESISKLREQAILDGKTHRPSQDNFAFQNMSVATESLLLDDVKYNFNFENYFSKITSSHEFEEKYKKKTRFPKKDNPKTTITVNFTIKGIGNSHERRKYEFEVYPYYNKKKTPEDDFGILFEWEPDEWDAFYNFMFSCVTAFYNAGSQLLTYHSTTMELKKLQAVTGGAFLDFADDIPRGEAVSYQDCFTEYKAIFSDKVAANVSPKSFSIKLKKYCEYHGLRYEYEKNSKTFTVTTDFNSAF